MAAQGSELFTGTLVRYQVEPEKDAPGRLWAAGFCLHLESGCGGESATSPLASGVILSVQWGGVTWAGGDTCGDGCVHCPDLWMVSWVNADVKTDQITHFKYVWLIVRGSVSNKAVKN